MPPSLRATTVALVAALMVAATGCSVTLTVGDDAVRGSGNLVRTDFSVDDASRLNVSSSFDVIVTVGGPMSVSIESDDNLVDRLDVRVNGDTLMLGLDGSTSRSTLRATVTMPSLSSIEAAGASNVTIGDFDVDQLSIDLAGASELTIGMIEADEIEASVNGASDLSIIGTTVSLELDAGGASDADLDDLVTFDAEIDIAGSSSVDIAGATSVRGSVSGSSTVTVDGDAAIDLDVSDASTIDEG